VTGGLSAVGEQSKIKLRGMPSNYTLVLVDGKRMGSSAATNYRPDLGRQDLNWISPDQIERIEVVRGPMSSLYGSDAMGG
jgi:outer membrane receptor for ferrienterochelin and colicins